VIVRRVANQDVLGRKSSSGRVTGYLEVACPVICTSEIVIVTPAPFLRLNDPQETVLYLDLYSGSVTRIYGRWERLDRWPYEGLHNFDLPWLYRHRPLHPGDFLHGRRSVALDHEPHLGLAASSDGCGVRSEIAAQCPSVDPGIPLTDRLAKRYRSIHLVFGKAVQFRHYPVTVNAERSALCLKPLGHLVLGRLPILDEAQVRRPARCQSGLIQLRWES
jgi:hypothetical protein